MTLLSNKMCVNASESIDISHDEFKMIVACIWLPNNKNGSDSSVNGKSIDKINVEKCWMDSKMWEWITQETEKVARRIQVKGVNCEL